MTKAYLLCIGGASDDGEVMRGLVAPVLFVVLGLTTIVWWDLTT